MEYHSQLYFHKNFKAAVSGFRERYFCQTEENGESL